MPSPIPQAVIDRDHDLDRKATRSQEALAKHRWEQTMDPTGPRYSFMAYARAVSRTGHPVHRGTIARSAHAWQLLLDHATSDNVAPGATFTIQDAERSAYVSAERREINEAIAQGSGLPLARVARGDNVRTAAIRQQAQDRAERRGTSAVDEARDIAERHRRASVAAAERRQQEAEGDGAVHVVIIEGHIAAARRKIRLALTEAEHVEFDDEELALLRHALDQLQQVLRLLDMRLAGAVDVDWDAELAALGDRP